MQSFIDKVKACGFALDHSTKSSFTAEIDFQTTGRGSCSISYFADDNQLWVSIRWPRTSKAIYNTSGGLIKRFENVPVDGSTFVQLLSEVCADANKRITTRKKNVAKELRFVENLEVDIDLLAHALTKQGNTP